MLLNTGDAWENAISFSFNRDQIKICSLGKTKILNNAQQLNNLNMKWNQSNLVCSLDNNKF